ncbi:Ribonuclease R [Bienertia sinuspersici]
MGKIRLKAWQLFVDKDHFKYVLRDYCIQEGFALVVKKADNKRYIAECVDIRCNWRIHASKLADEHTFAIKNIRQEHLCDLNLTDNPMLLSDRYEITMTTSTLYKMRAKGLQIIQGGHDERYCARHLCKNFKEYPGVLMHKLFWGVTNSYSLFTFRKSMEQVGKFAGLGAVKWLKEVGPLER